MGGNLRFHVQTEPESQKLWQEKQSKCEVQPVPLTLTEFHVLQVKGSFIIQSVSDLPGKVAVRMKIAFIKFLSVSLAQSQHLVRGWVSVLLTAANPEKVRKCSEGLLGQS